MKAALVLLAWSGFAYRSATPALEGSVQGGVEGGIGCDVCAVAVVVDVFTTDDAGGPLPDVEVWYATPPPRLPGEENGQPNPAGRARRLGITDSSGRLIVPECFMGSQEFRFTTPGPTVRLEFLLFREEFGATRVVREIPVGEVLHTGYVLGKPMSDPLQNGYHAVLAKTLPRVRQGASSSGSERELPNNGIKLTGHSTDHDRRGAPQLVPSVRRTSERQE